MTIWSQVAPVTVQEVMYKNLVGEDTGITEEMVSWLSSEDATSGKKGWIRGGKDFDVEYQLRDLENNYFEWLGFQMHNKDSIGLRIHQTTQQTRVVNDEGGYDVTRSPGPIGHVALQYYH